MGRIPRRNQHNQPSDPFTRSIMQCPYRTGPQVRQFVSNEVEKMLDAGFIECSQSKWASTAGMPPKPDASYRLCADYHKLNAETILDTYRLPHMDDFMGSLRGTNVFFTLDANLGYWHVALEVANREKTMFTRRRSTYWFSLMPFVLINAPATLQCLLITILSR